MEYEDQFEPEPEQYCAGAEMQEEERARERLKRKLEQGEPDDYKRIPSGTGQE